MQIEVKCYSGYKADERPVEFRLEGREYKVEQVLDRWYGTEADYFRVKADDANVYILRHNRGDDTWALEGYRNGTR